MSPRVNEIVFRHLIAYMRFATHAICECMIFMAIGYGMAIGGKAAQHGTQPARTETIPAFATVLKIVLARLPQLPKGRQRLW